MIRNIALVALVLATPSFAIDLSSEPIKPIPAAPQFDSRKVALGELLYNDTRLSSDDTISCASCHILANGGDDDRARSVGVKGGVGGVNSPTTFNSGLNFKQFWDGRADTLEDQAGGPVENPVEMGARWDDVLVKLNKDQGLVAQFKALYPDGVQVANVKDAIATFERTLVTPNSPFDKYLLGDQGAITEEAKAGYALFKSVGCTACHSGVNVGGQMFQKFGLVGDYFKDRGAITESDYGRFNVTKKEEDRFFFRVAPLRNVAETAPYFHDASAKTLEEAVSVMGKYQLGRQLSSDEVSKIVAFLKTLTGEYKGKPVGK